MAGMAPPLSPPRFTDVDTTSRPLYIGKMLATMDGEQKSLETNETPEKNWFAQLQPCRWVLLALQVWPVCERSGRVVFQKRSPHSLYAALAWTATAVIAYRGLLHWIQVIGVSGYFSLKAYFAFFVIVGHTPLVIPLLHWTTLHKVARAFNFSHRFQANFLRVFRVPLRLNLARRAMVIGFVSPLVGISITFWAHFYGFIPWQQFPTYEMSATYLTILPGTWEVTVFGLETSAQQLLHQLTQVLRGEGGFQRASSPSTTPIEIEDTNETPIKLSLGRNRIYKNNVLRGNFVIQSAKLVDMEGTADDSGTKGVGSACHTAGRLREVRWLWLQLDHSARLWTHAWTYALAHLLLFSMATFLLSVFGVTIPLLRVKALDDRQAGMVVGIVHQFHIIYSVCTAGYRVRTQVRDPFIKELLMTKFPNTKAAIYQEVMKFLDAIDMQETKVSLRGYVTLNRALSVTCAAILLTYVIVLLQFAYAKGAQ